MPKNLLMIAGIVVVAVAFAIGIIGLATSTPTPAVPSPTRFVVSGVIAMMAALCAFILGFVHMATVGNRSPTK